MKLKSGKMKMKMKCDKCGSEKFKFALEQNGELNMYCKECDNYITTCKGTKVKRAWCHVKEYREDWEDEKTVQE